MNVAANDAHKYTVLYLLDQLQYEVFCCALYSVLNAKQAITSPAEHSLG